MPDIRTALTTALKEWDTDRNSKTKEEKKVQTGFKVTSNVARLTFNLIKNNPHIKPHEITAWAKANGLNPDSAYAVAAKSVRDGYMARTEDNGFITIVPEYQSPKTRKKAKVEAEKAKPIKPIKAIKPIKEVESKGIKALIAEPKIEQPTANSILHSINVVQAKKLYEELKAIFE